MQRIMILPQCCGSDTFFGSGFHFRRVLDPDSYKDTLDLLKVTDPVSDPTLNILSFTMPTIKKAFSHISKHTVPVLF
jgi:hypothetical protein